LAFVEALPGFDRDRVLQLAAALEKASEHVLAKALLAAVKAPLPPVDGFESIPGKGVRGTVEGEKVIVGNADLVAGLSAVALAKAEAERRDGRTVVFVSIGGKAAGLLGIADPIKPSSAEAVQRLKRDGIRVVMCSGDHRATVEAVARELGIAEAHAGVLPADKGELVKKLRSQGRIVAMAGDGVNDAPALALADVGIAMGHGTDVAMETAGITLVKGDLRGIARARALSRATMRNIRGNLFFAFFYNALGVPIAAGVLYPFFGILISPMLASAAMSLSSVSVIANALRLRTVKI
jgi:Cu+-exporting ATPase